MNPINTNKAHSLKSVNGLNLLQYAKIIEPVLQLLKDVTDTTAAITLIDDLFKERINSIIKDQTCQMYVVGKLKTLSNQDPSHIYKLAKVLLEQLPEYIWYYKETSVLADKNLTLLDLRKLENHQISFKFVVLNNSIVARIKRFLKYRLLGRKLYTVGMQTPWGDPAIVALLNQINQILIKELETDSFQLQVNSMYRSWEHQRQLSDLGYIVTDFSSHCYGLAADIEQQLYRDQHPRIHALVEKSLYKLYDQNVINLIDSGIVWHVCLNPEYIKYYTSMFQEDY